MPDPRPTPVRDRLHEWWARALAWRRRHPWTAAFRVASGLLIAALALTWLSLPRVYPLAEEWPEETAFMKRYLRSSGAESVDYHPVPLSRVPERVRRAILVSEDAAFFEHSGFDFHELKAALSEAWEEKRLPRGASTVTQQLARNLYLSPGRTLWRKLREAAVTRRLETRLSKSRILELYLSVIEFGPGVYGVEAASRRYFGKSVTNISRREAAELAASIPAPSVANPASRTRGFRFRANLAFQRAFGSVRENDSIPPPPTLESLDVPAPVDTAGRADDSLPVRRDSTATPEPDDRQDTIRAPVVR